MSSPLRVFLPVLVFVFDGEFAIIYFVLSLELLLEEGTNCFEQQVRFFESHPMTGVNDDVSAVFLDGWSHHLLKCLSCEFLFHIMVPLWINDESRDCNLDV